MRPTVEELVEVLLYDPDTGLWTWRARVANCVQIGDHAGKIDSHGYRQITIKGVAYLASRLAWLYMTGAWPTHQIDHRDLNPGNDCWANLRHATRSQNFANQRAYANNRLGVKGVSLRKNGRFLAQIQVNGRKIMLGYHATADAASAAYAAAARAHFGEFARSA